MPRLPTRPGDGGLLKQTLGLVCLTQSAHIRYRTVTRTRLLPLALEDQLQILTELYRHNACVLRTAIALCPTWGIWLYRIPSGLFPAWDSPAGTLAGRKLEPELALIGETATRTGVRLVFHPDPYVVLNSERPEVVVNSRQILSRFGRLMDLLGQPRHPWAAIQLHGGKRGRPDALIQTVRDLPDDIRSRLCLENDERAYGAAEILAVCQASGLPMVFDAHHHLVHERLDSYDHPSVAFFTEQSRATWPDPNWQLVHISNGRESLHDTRHSAFITRMPEAFKQVPWIEVEAKAKEQAIAQLQTTWLTA